MRSKTTLLRNKAVPNSSARRSAQGNAPRLRSGLLLLIWFLFGACLVYWFSQARALSWSPDTLAPSVQTVAMDSLSQASSGNAALPPMAYVMGAASQGLEKTDELTQAPAALNVQLLGVLMNGAGRQAVGVALMAVDGQAARVFRLGQEVMPGWQLARIEAKEVTLKQPKAPSGERIVALAQPSPDSAPAAGLPLQTSEGMFQPGLNPAPVGNPESRPPAASRLLPKQP